jgi:arylsulfatase A-like enzyme
MVNPPSLILVTVDCLRADHVGWLGYDQPTTPFLDSIAAGSVVFSNAIVAGTPTYYSFPAIMASRPPLALGRDVVGIAPGEPTIASILKRTGYATAAFVATNPYLSRCFGYDSGFDVFEDFSGESGQEPPAAHITTKSHAWAGVNRRLAQLSHKASWSGALYDELYFQYCQRLATPRGSYENLRPFPSADLIVSRALAWLADQTGKPFFLWLHFMDAHAPYYPSQDAWKAMEHPSLTATRAKYLNAYWNRSDLGASRLRKHRAEIIELYDAGIRWVDMQLSLLVKTLRDLDLWEGAVIAVTADHGEEFLEHGGRYHSPAQLGEEIIRVPLLIRQAGAPATARIETPFSLLHLGPTLLDACGIEPPDSFCGRSAWAPLKRGEGFSDTAVLEVVPACTNPLGREKRTFPRTIVLREQNFKLIFDLGTSSVKLFDLSRDPLEQNALAEGAEKAIRKRLLENALRHMTHSLKERDSEAVLMARLRDVRLECARSGVASSA